jgi:hypothetical protein
MHDLLFENPLHLKTGRLRKYAEDEQLDLERYDYEMGDHVDLQRVHEHIDGGVRSWVRAIPLSSSTAFFETCSLDRSTCGGLKAELARRR